MIVLLIVVFVLELYTFFALKTLTKNKVILIGFWVLAVVVYVFIYYQLYLSQQQSRFSHSTGYAIALFLAFAIPKVVVFIGLFLEDIVRFFQTIFNFFQYDSGLKEAIPSRRKFISQLALGIAAIPFASLLYGVFKGRYNYKVLRYAIYFEDLLDAFNGYTITQISDIHSGSFDNKEKIEYGVDLINQQQSDAILFTGDIVNAVAEEMTPWIDTFKKLKAKDGKYAILGNHDYGYYAYDSLVEIENNHKKIQKVHQQIGFDLLLNNHRKITRNNQSINIVGVENWGSSRHFPKRGSLVEATKGISNGEFNILMSHDPSHFDFKDAEIRTNDPYQLNLYTNEPNIIDFEKKIQLTLSGHTHGMQFGIEIPFLNFKWSPVKYRYPKWAGLYKEKGQYLHVNRGFGYLAFPGRIGIWPEITVIELKKGTKPA